MLAWTWIADQWINSWTRAKQSNHNQKTSIMVRRTNASIQQWDVAKVSLGKEGNITTSHLDPIQGKFRVRIHIHNYDTPMQVGGEEILGQKCQTIRIMCAQEKSLNPDPASKAIGGS
jgi:hypothetical protein